MIGRLSLSLALLALPVWGVAGQTPEGRLARAQLAGPDSAEAVREARDAQGRFERRRTRWVGVERGGGWGTGCDEILGRMCLHLEEGRDWWPGPDEPELVEARDALIATLARARESAPGDAWVLGQQVVYLGEAGRWDEALQVARACGPVEVWWCAALEGLALHALHRFQGAEAAFERALAAMPPTLRSDWLDLEPLLDGSGRGHWSDLDGEARETAARRFWRLADPLYLVDGNDRWTGHLARRTVARTREDARNPYGMAWGGDLDDLLVRYGWEVGWERIQPSAGSMSSSGGTIGHHHPYTRGYTPLGEAWRHPEASEPDDWNPGSRTRPRTGYVPAYAPVFLPADAEIAVLPRGDSVTVVAALALPADTTWHAGHDHGPLPVADAWAGRPPRIGLFVLDRDDGRVVGSSVAAGSAEGTVYVTVPAGDGVVSAEVWSPAEGRAGRVRRGLRAPRVPPDVPTLSDLMVARPGTRDPETLDELARLLVHGARFEPGDTVRVAWEVHGFGWRDEVFAYALAVQGDEGNVLTRAGRWLGLVGDPREVAIDWSEDGPDAPGPALRSVLLVLPPDLETGAYRLRLELASQGRSTLVSERWIEVVPGGTARR